VARLRAVDGARSLDWPLPPSVLPPAVVQLYVACSDDADAFGASVIVGGDAELDLTAQVAADLAGRLVTDGSHPAFVGADDQSELQVYLVGLVAALEMLAARGDTAPLLLRLGSPAAAACVAGVWQPTAANRLRSRITTLIRAARESRGRVWVAGYDPLRLHPFGERAAALAYYGARHGFWGNLPASWASATPTAPLQPSWAAEECSVCFQDYTDPWPHPQVGARAPPCRWHCDHAVCRACDATVQNGVNSRCPLCRAPRRVLMHP